MAYESYYTNKIIKTTKAQYDALKNGESVKGYKLNEKDTFVLDIDSLYNDLNNYVAKRNQLENNVDLNTVTTTGFYRLNNTHANSPSAPFGQMLVCQAYGDTIAQVVFRYNEPKMFLRTGNVVNNNAGLWTEWKTVSTDGHTHDDRYYTETEIDTKISGTSGTIPKFTAASTIGNSVITQSAQNDITIAGKLVVQSNGSTSNNSYNEGIRILPASNAWSNIFFSNNQTTSGQHANGWLLGKRGSNGTTSGLAGDFTIECNGSSGAGLTLSSDVKNKPRWNNNELAYYSDIPTYWANVQLSSTSDANTTPTFASVDIKSKCTVSYSVTADALEFIFK